MLTVHHLQRSQSERIVWLCEELGLDYELKTYERAPLTAPPDLASLHPLGKAPVITDASSNSAEPLVLAESGAIVQYITTKYGNDRLTLSPSHPNYADYLFWLHFANGNLQSLIMRGMYYRPLHLASDHFWQKRVDGGLHQSLALMNDRLVKAKWLAGDEFTAAEIMNVFSLTTMRAFLPIDLSQYPEILRWLADVGARPGYQQAMKKGDPGFEPALDAKGPALHPAVKDL